MATRIHHQTLPGRRIHPLLLAGLLALLSPRAPAALCDDLLSAERRQAEQASLETQDLIAYLERLLDRKVAENNRVIAEAGPMPAKLASGADASGRQCEDLLSDHRAGLNGALKKYNEERACLAESHASIPSEIIRIVRAMNNVRCDAAGEQRPRPGKPQSPATLPSATSGPGAEKPPKPVELPRLPSPSSLPRQCSGTAPAGNRTRVPSVLGMSHRRAKMEMALAGLTSFVFEYQQAENPSENGRVTGTNPGPCAVVPIGSTVDIAYKADYVAPDDDGSQRGGLGR